MKDSEGFTKVDSGHLHSVRYNSMEQKLTVRFQNGAEYAVRGVQPSDYAEFMESPSQGEHYHRVFKDNFDIERAK